MPKIVNDCLIRTLLRQPAERRPIWIMRQAGRYLPEYRALRAQVPDFMSFCKTSELAAQATLQPLQRYDLDAAIVFSDILTIPAAMGLQLEFKTGEGPVFADPIRSQADLARLKPVDVLNDLGYVMQTIRYVTSEITVPLIGFAGSPWTVACYMVEGRGSRDFATLRKLCYQQPQLIHELLQRLTEVTVDYLNAQVSAGARVLQVFDTWGGLLTTPLYQEFSLQYLAAIAAGVKRDVDGQRIPLIFFTKQGGQWLELIAQSGCDAIGLDWTINIANAKARVGQQVALQGNLDPLLLFADASTVRENVQQCLRDFGDGPGHVVNLGHGILPQTPPENVAAMIEAVRCEKHSLL